MIQPGDEQFDRAVGLRAPSRAALTKIVGAQQGILVGRDATFDGLPALELPSVIAYLKFLKEKAPSVDEPRTEE